MIKQYEGYQVKAGFKGLRSVYIFLLMLLFLGVRNSYSQSTDENKVANTINPLRGLFNWENKGFVPLSGTATENYRRFSWAQLEHGEGEYDFSVIENNLNKLKPGQRLMFGIMALNSCCGSPSGIEVPEYIVQKPGKAFFVVLKGKKLFIPDWNDPYFLDRVDKLFQALGNKYNDDPRIAWMEIRIYGDWGEWHLGGLSESYSNNIINKLNAQPATLASKQRIILAQVVPFSKTRLQMMTDDNEALLFALKQKTNIPIGMSRDSWGSVHFERDFLNSATTDDDKKFILERWKIAPVIVESYGGDKVFEVGTDGVVKQILNYHVSSIANGGFFPKATWDSITTDQRSALTLASIKAGYNLKVIAANYPKAISLKQALAINTTWKNYGSAPVYEKWNVQLLLYKNSKDLTPVWKGNSKLDLHSIMPDLDNFNQVDKFNLPANLLPGNYVLAIKIIDPLKYKLPMNLLNDSKLSNNAYFLGNITINK